MANDIIISSILLLFLATNARAGCPSEYPKRNPISDSDADCSEWCNLGSSCSSGYSYDPNRYPKCCLSDGSTGHNVGYNNDDDDNTFSHINLDDFRSFTEKSYNTSIIVGAVISVVLVISIIAVVIYLLWRRKRGLGFGSTRSTTTTTSVGGGAGVVYHHPPQQGPPPPAQDAPPSYYSLQGQPGAYPTQPGAYPQQLGAYPPQTGAYPQQLGAYPPQPGSYQPQSGGFQPQTGGIQGHVVSPGQPTVYQPPDPQETKQGPMTPSAPPNY